MNENYNDLKPYYADEFRMFDENPSYKGKFNIVAFLFSVLWLLSKGVTKVGVILFAILLVLNIIYMTTGYLVTLIGLPIAIYVGLKGNSMFYAEYKKKKNI